MANGDLTPDPSGNVTLTAAEHQSLVQARDDALQTIGERNREIQELKTSLRQKNQENEEAQANFDRQIADLQKTQNEEKRAYEGQVNSLQAALNQAIAALKDGGKHSKAEIKEAVSKKMLDWIRDVGFRTTKFAKGAALDRFVVRVFEAIKDDLDLLNEGADHYTTLEEFKRIYTASIQKALGDRRQYVQTQILKAFVRESIRLLSGVHKLKTILH